MDVLNGAVPGLLCEGGIVSGLEGGVADGEVFGQDGFGDFGRKVGGEGCKGAGLEGGESGVEGGFL